MSQIILDQNLEKPIYKPEFHNLVKGFLKVFFAYYLYSFCNYIYMIAKNDFIDLFIHVSNLVTIVFYLMEMFCIYRIYKYKKRGFYDLAKLMIIQLILNYVFFYKSIPEWKNLLSINIAFTIVYIGILWSFLQIKKDNIKAWDLLK